MGGHRKVWQKKPCLRRVCGAVFQPTGAGAKYCPACQAFALKRQDVRRKAKRIQRRTMARILGRAA